MKTSHRPETRINAFWERKAVNYPLPFEKTTCARTARIVRLIEKMGVDFKGRSLLDIGCGTGVYGLFLAGKTAKALGVDSSPTMLARFREQARARKIKNAACLPKNWKTAKKLPGAPFDIALVSMSHAVRDRADILRMERMAREKCVYVGWAGVRKNPFMERVYKAHGLAYEAPDGGEQIIAVLKKLERKPKIKFITDAWRWSGSYKEACAAILPHLKLNDAPIRRKWLEKFLKSRLRKGRITHKTSARKVLIAWNPPGKLQIR